VEKEKNMNTMTRWFAVLVLASLMACGTGCETVHATKHADLGYTVSGDAPRFGEFIRVREIKGHETQGPYMYDIRWSYYKDEVGSHTCYSKGDNIPGLNRPGVYVVAHGMDGGIYFAEVK
jgi:hypothetical protein